MTEYEKLLSTAPAVIENYHFESKRIKGLYCDGTIALSSNIRTTAERACVLAEELGHHYTSTGDIIDQSSPSNRKQELHARLWGFNKLVGLTGIVSCYRAGCRNLFEMSEHLEVTEDFLKEAIECYRHKYGAYKRLDNYIIYFEPTLGVFEMK